MTRTAKPLAPFTLNPASKAGIVGTTRDKMAFVEEFATVDGRPAIIIRLYRTTGGTYGPQYRAVAWMHAPTEAVGPWAGDKTNGCGYSKPNAAVASLLHAMGSQRNDEGAEPLHQLERAFPGRRWHHAHG